MVELCFTDSVVAHRVVDALIQINCFIRIYIHQQQTAGQQLLTEKYTHMQISYT